MSEIEDLKIVGGSTYTVGNQDIIANEWEAGKTYVKNRSYVIQEHRLYVCNVTHTSVEPFDTTKWTEITIGDAIGNNIGDLSTLTTTDKSSLVGAVNEVNAKIKTYNWSSTNVAITTLYSGGSMYYCDVTFPSGEATDSNEILALTMVDYGGLSNVLQFQIRGSRSFRIWSKTSMTLSTLTVKILYSK